MKDRITPWQLGWALIKMHLKGWRSIPGYSVTNTESDGTRYIAMWLENK